MSNPAVSEEGLWDALKLLSEMTDIARNLEAKNKSTFHAQLHKNGLFAVLEATLARENEKIRLTRYASLLFPRFPLEILFR